MKSSKLAIALAGYLPSQEPASMPPRTIRQRPTERKQRPNANAGTAANGACSAAGQLGRPLYSRRSD
ncbi:hypothetical protein [Exiguobacterium sp. AM39-5BH]|uniref:hypothetical protein n=1 Tax=Exiguobacterium sp. AM39-5BH TaxID=2292355 RepID=UPI000FE1F4DC|nr:hypothetical protein [Exiguobacterium sp. AM39-5BH]